MTALQSTMLLLSLVFAVAGYLEGLKLDQLEQQDRSDDHYRANRDLRGAA